jgi:nitrite reductase/ring-hydroxylating ferredoxin subunit
VTRELFGHRLVAFRSESGKVSVLDARCAHLGTDLGRGCVIGESIRCPYHHWEFGLDGRCSRIPASADIPAFARQRVFPTAQRHGYLFVFNDREPNFPLPFYQGVTPDELLCSRPDSVVLDCPWYMIGANAFDLQHFRASHDRVLMGEPAVDCPAEFARRASARFSVSGNSLQDRLTRLLAGDEVSLSITDYCGNMMFATAKFRRASSYGLVVTQPLDTGRVLVRLFVMKRRSRSLIGRLFYDRLSLAVRQRFLRNFLSSDVERLIGVRYSPGRLIAADQILMEYFQWLAAVSHRRTARNAQEVE